MTETYASLYNHPTQHQTLMAGALAYKMIVNNLIGHKFACLAFCQEGLYEMPCSGFQPVQPVGWKLGWPGRWARRVGVAVQVLPPEVGVARSVPGQAGGHGCPCPAPRGGRGPAQCLPLLSACLWLPAPSPGSLQP